MKTSLLEEVQKPFAFSNILGNSSSSIIVSKLFLFLFFSQPYPDNWA
jgi:hypothetical protein